MATKERFIPINEVPGRGSAYHEGACCRTCDARSGVCTHERVTGLRVSEGATRVAIESCDPRAVRTDAEPRKAVTLMATELPPEETQRRRVLADLRRVQGKRAKRVATGPKRTELRYRLARAEHNAIMSTAWRSDARRAAGDKGRPSMAGSVEGVEVATRTAWVLASTPAPVRGERIVAWNLDAFRKNPAILWGHDATMLPIGVAEQVDQTEDGLRVLVRFASAEANPLAEAVLRCADEGVVRAVSVGFETTRTLAELPDGTKEVEASLREVSFVSVGADEDAGTSALNPAAVDGARKRAATDGRPPFGAPKPPKNSAGTGGDQPYDPWSGETIAQIAEDEGAADDAKALAAMADEQRTDARDPVTEAIRKRDAWARDAWRRQ